MMLNMFIAIVNGEYQLRTDLAVQVEKVLNFIENIADLSA